MQCYPSRKSKTDSKNTQVAQVTHPNQTKWALSWARLRARGCLPGRQWEACPCPWPAVSHARPAAARRRLLAATCAGACLSAICPALVPVGAGWVRGSTALAGSEEAAIQTATVSQALWLHAWACSADCVRAADTLSTASLAAAAKRPRTSPRIPRASHTLCFFSSPSSRPGYSVTR